ncbi:hypothetical protein GOP47_0001249 [Adiantum capillus-veneris]|uniref:Uncharacterized protein n=1 Tax=Adiantum capillus-veneris TaxID=13818 RepID=A0A9D4VEG9_ADICA|nr:hypothetical protein GOP47_0001249 [Adiantum capillus-veneris]
MGTAVLLPHDCLRNTKSKHKGHLSEAILHSDRAYRARRDTLQASVLSDPPSTVCGDHGRKSILTGRVEWTPKSTPPPLHDRGLDSLQLQKEVEGGQLKATKPTDVKEARSASRFACDVPVFTILQRPKSKEAADELIAKFLVKVEGEKLADCQFNPKQELSESQNVTTGKNHDRHFSFNKPKLQSSNITKSSEMKLSKRNSKKGGCVMTPEESKILDSNLNGPKLTGKVKSNILEAALNAGKGQCRNMAPCPAQPVHVPRRESQRRLDDVMHLKGLRQVASLKATSEYEDLKIADPVESLRSKHLHQTQQTALESTLSGCLSRLRRATTDPQVVKQLVGHFRSDVVDIPSAETKLCNRFARTASMSCPERWAGPSYYTSPAPSSLPLPKFSRLNNQGLSSKSSGEGRTKFMPEYPDSETSSPEWGPTKNISESPDLEASSPASSALQGAVLDVAFATKSLRRMLKLDPL